MVSCSQSGISTIEPMKEPNVNNMASADTAKPRCLNTLRLTMGCSSVSSQARNARKKTPAVNARLMMKFDENQSSFSPLSIMICSAPIKVTINARPTKSMGFLTVLVSNLVRMLDASITQSTATGTLMKKDHGQPQLSARVPATNGPAMGPRIVVMVQMPRAMLRRSGGAMRINKVCDMGIKGPPITPCITRVKISMGSDWERPQRSEKTPN